MTSSQPSQSPGGSGLREISDREVQVLTLVAQGHGNREIGDKLSISEGTVKNHVKSIIRKLEARDRTHAVVLAMAADILDQPAKIILIDAARLQGKG